MHLIRRFVGFVTADPLSPREQAYVSHLLRPALARAFFAQRHEDQRHALDVQHRAGGSDERAEAALLHDVGKTESDVGAIGRSLATLLSGVGVPIRGRWLRYLDHSSIGAKKLSSLGASDLSVAFARHHPGSPPEGIDPEEWRALEEADEA